MRILLLVSMSTTTAFARPQCVDAFADRPQGLSFTQKAFIWGTTAAVALAPMAALAGGFSGVGGGGGVATFKTPADAHLARKYLNEGKPVPRELLDRAEIRLLEMWEMNDKIALFSAPPDADWRMLYAKALSNLRIISPLLVRKIERVNSWMDFESWKTAEHIPHIPDVEPMQPMGALNVPMQLAIRLSKGNHRWGEGPTRGDLELRVIFNRELFDRLTPVEQAMLVLHEQIYALAQATGHSTSDEARPLVKIAFSKHLDTEVREKTENGIKSNGFIRLVKTRTIEQFGDYILYFSRSDRLDRGAPRSADRHYTAFVEVLLKIRKKLNVCKKSGMSQDQCYAKIFQSILDDGGGLQGEQAFIFILHFGAERKANLFNAESVMDAARTPEEHKLAMEEACKLVRQLGFERPSAVLEAAKLYCR